MGVALVLYLSDKLSVIIQRLEAAIQLSYKHSKYIYHVTSTSSKWYLPRKVAQGILGIIGPVPPDPGTPVPFAASAVFLSTQVIIHSYI